jgi:hypothetical protein
MSARLADIELQIRSLLVSFEISSHLSRPSIAHRNGSIVADAANAICRSRSDQSLFCRSAQPMSLLGQTEKYSNEQIFSALPPIADILGGRLARLSSGGRECFHSISNILQMPLGERPARA